MLSPQRIALLTLAALLFACGTSPLLPEDEAELNSRQSADARLGEPMQIFDWPPIRVAGLFSHDGRAHVFAIRATKELQHVEIDANGVVVRQNLAVLDEDPTKTPLDAIEWPPGTLRVAAGSRQFVRSAGGAVWQEAKANRCVHFFTATNRLYCSFVMSGAELGSPKRTDFYSGLIILIPFVVSVEKQSQKLVVAEAVGDGWVIRSVVDADDPLDALGSLAIGADAEGNVHVLYEAGRGGALIILFPAGQGGVYEEPKPTIRYTRISHEALRLPGEGTPEVPARPLALAKGFDVSPPPSLKSEGTWDVRAGRLLSSLAVSPTSGALEGLAPVDEAVPIDRHGKAVRFSGILGVKLRERVWQQPASVVSTNDWPVQGLDYGFVSAVLRPNLRFDSSGALHALVPLCTNHPFWEDCVPALSYVVKQEGGEWSRPLIFTTGVYSGRLAVDHAQAYSLLVASEARVYIGWIEKDAGFLGRWIFPRDRTLDKSRTHSNSDSRPP